MEINDFEVMNLMSKGNKDIRVSTDFQTIKTNKQGALISVGVDRTTALDFLMSGKKYKVALYIINSDEFDEIKKKYKEL